MGKEVPEVGRLGDRVGLMGHRFRLAAAMGALGVLSSAGMGIASAAPDLSAAINTTCTYPQVMAALNAQAPQAAARLNATPVAQSFIQKFLAAPPAKREQMAQRAQSMTGPGKDGGQYTGLMSQILDTCNNY